MGVFGGSFNPIHFGHLLVADEVCETLRLDRLLLVPAAQPPHKPAAELAPAVHRYRMTALAVREHPRFEVSDVEVKRSGPSYTVDTLTALQDRGRLYLIIGSETFLDLLNWREPWRVAALARLVVIPRNGMGFDPETPAALKVLRELGLPGFARDLADPTESTAPLLVHAASLPISGSDLRRRAREGRSLAFRMPESVVAYIREHQLYRPEA
ncbi:MAG TPA: nicotinate-nucleotide adenylyltransferase [Candidatus Deferrimicrobiaceae bacterium]|nr:nicotinate-nucleotide adenylyltransferase [Candidatus Deferrimicrobiaceae bacterium]